VVAWSFFPARSVVSDDCRVAIAGMARRDEQVYVIGWITTAMNASASAEGQ
jgi:hypothetical protein